VAGVVATLPFALPVFPIVLIALGALMAVSALRRRQTE
jgi:cytochrome c-type biogenesis protein CcmH/NrfF